jgi:hypothetical protein
LINLIKCSLSCRRMILSSSACLVSRHEKTFWFINLISAKLDATKSSPFRVMATLLSLRSPASGCLFTKPSSSRPSIALKTACVDLNILLEISVGVMTPPCVIRLCKILKRVGVDSSVAVSVSRYLLNKMVVSKIDNESSPFSSKAWPLIALAKDSSSLFSF